MLSPRKPDQQSNLGSFRKSWERESLHIYETSRQTWSRLTICISWAPDGAEKTRFPSNSIMTLNYSHPCPFQCWNKIWFSLKLKSDLTNDTKLFQSSFQVMFRGAVLAAQMIASSLVDANTFLFSCYTDRHNIMAATWAQWITMSSFCPEQVCLHLQEEEGRAVNFSPPDFQANFK